MCGCKYFYPDGEEITKKEFINFYSKVYCYKNIKHWNSELDMKNLLSSKNVDLTTGDIVQILLWKTNGKQEKPRDGAFRIKDFNRTIVIRDDQDEVLKLNQFKGVPWGSIGINSAEEFVWNFAARAYTTERVIDKDSDETVINRGIGFVYAVTLLFFATRGAYPIYDRYAHIGLKSAMDGRNPIDEQCKITPSCYDKMFRSAYHKKGEDISRDDFGNAWKDYLGYKANLMEKNENPKGVFADEYDEDVSHYRDIDRALWAYGHLFYKS